LLIFILYGRASVWIGAAFVGAIFAIGVRLSRVDSE
jgi:hypothetical protein